MLKQGDLLAIAPGAGLEANFSGNCYDVIWMRRGFTKVAIEARVVSSGFWNLFFKIEMNEYIT